MLFETMLMLFPRNSRSVSEKLDAAIHVALPEEPRRCEPSGRLSPFRLVQLEGFVPQFEIIYRYGWIERWQALVRHHFVAQLGKFVNHCLAVIPVLLQKVDIRWSDTRPKIIKKVANYIVLKRPTKTKTKEHKPRWSRNPSKDIESKFQKSRWLDRPDTAGFSASIFVRSNCSVVFVFGNSHLCARRSFQISNVLSDRQQYL